MYLLVVDYYSHFVEIALMTTMTMAQTAHHMQSMFARHGFPETSVSDNGPQFLSAEFAAFATNHKIHLVAHHLSNNAREFLTLVLPVIGMSLADALPLLNLHDPGNSVKGYHVRHLIVDRLSRADEREA